MSIGRSVAQRCRRSRVRVRVKLPIAVAGRLAPGYDYSAVGGPPNYGNITCIASVHWLANKPVILLLCDVDLPAQSAIELVTRLLCG